MPRPPLTVRRSPTGYVMHDPALVQLAGIDNVPLPFTRRAAPAVVLAHLRRLSPHREVQFDPALQLDFGGSPSRTLNPEP